MLAAQVSEKLAGRSGVPGLHILVAATEALHRFGKILPLPLQVGARASSRAAAGS